MTELNIQKIYWLKVSLTRLHSAFPASKALDFLTNQKFSFKIYKLVIL